MKKLLLLLLLSTVASQASSISTRRTTTVSFTTSGPNYDIAFHIQWTCDDYPQNSAPGELQVHSAAGDEIGRVIASTYESGPEVNVSGNGTVDNIESYVGVFGGGAPADGYMSGVWHLTGLTPGTYRVTLWDFQTWDTQYLATTVWTHTLYLGGSEPVAPPPANTPPQVNLISPGDQTVIAGTTLTISSRATDPDGSITSHNLDIQRPAGDWNFQGGFATGEPFQGGPVGSGGDSTRTASFTFTDVGTYYVRAAADDGSGWVHSATVAITVVPAAPTQYVLATTAGTGGTVTPGGTYNAGTVVYITATPDGAHDFSGWSGDAGGATNPLGLAIDGNKNVTATFSPKLIPLTTSASAGGSVTPGGNYPYGTSITISAIPDATHTFLGWAGDASGSISCILLTVTSPLNVQAVFSSKTAQTINFPSPGNQPAGGPAFTLTGSSSSGLPVAYTVLTGPATLSGNQLQITGPGAITVQASQPGDALYLPAASVTQTFNAVATALVKYRPGGRTLLQASAADHTTLFVLEKP